MLGMFWIARELSKPNMGLITRLPLTVTKLTAIKKKGVVKFVNCVAMWHIAAWRFCAEMVLRLACQAWSLEPPPLFSWFNQIN